MTLVEDLKAARALIDTPEKWEDVGNLVFALNEAVASDDDEAFREARDYLRKVNGRLLAFLDYDEACELLDRAIANAEQKP